MQVTTKAIVLSSLKYGDSSLIVKAFTATDGLKSYLLKGVLTSKKGKFRLFDIVRHVAVDFDGDGAVEVGREFECEAMKKYLPVVEGD